MQSKQSEKIEKNHDIRVITFNILSQSCISDTYFPYAKKHYLAFESRCKKIKKLLSSWMKVNFIICLQEVSIQWRNELNLFFKNNKYEFEAITYNNDQMGVAIAYPINHYDLLEKNEFRLGTDIKNIHYALSSPLKETNDDIEIVRQELAEAAELNNSSLTLLLSCKSYGKYINKNLIISTYHMPCRFKNNYLMISHIHVLKDKLKQLEDTWILKYNESSISLILTGDFNTIPNSAEYKLLIEHPDLRSNLADRNFIDEKETQAKLLQSNNHNELKTLNVMSNIYNELGINLLSGKKLKSVHHTLHNTEPKYTNVAIKKDIVFVNCIDYILIGENIDVRSCTVGLTVNNPETVPYPNGLCPSDHVPLSASLFIK